jgi:hypothetical protein
MKVVYTTEALKDLEDIGSYIATHYRAIAPAAQQRLRAAMTHIAHWRKAHAPLKAVPACASSRCGNTPTKSFIGSGATSLRCFTSTMPLENLGPIRRT